MYSARLSQYFLLSALTLCMFQNTRAEDDFASILNNAASSQQQNQAAGQNTTNSNSGANNANTTANNSNSRSNNNQQQSGGGDITSRDSSDFMRFIGPPDQQRSSRNQKRKRVTPPPKDADKVIRDAAFGNLLDRTFPLKPNEVMKIKEELRKSQKAVSTPASAPPQPVSSTLTVDLSPGSSAPVIRLAKGFVTTMVFLDATGQPWPPADYSIGNAKDFNIQWDKQTNTLFVQSLKDFVHTNMAMRMSGLDTPIVLSFVTDQREVDYRIDLQIQARGPNAKMPIAPNLPQQMPNYLISALDGLPPNGSKQLKVANVDAQAWMYNNKIILRTNYPLLSPAWSSTLSSVDGTRVYEIPLVPSVLLSVDGRPTYASILGM